MANIIAKRYVCKECGSDYLVLYGGDGQLNCCGKPMEIKTEDVPSKLEGASYPEEVKTVLGRKYVCAKCGTVVICSQPSKDVLVCCGETMQLVEPKPIKAAF